MKLRPYQKIGDIPYQPMPDVSGMSERDASDTLFMWEEENSRRRWHNSQPEDWKLIVPFDMRSKAERREEFFAIAAVNYNREGGWA